MGNSKAMEYSSPILTPTRVTLEMGNTTAKENTHGVQVTCIRAPMNSEKRTAMEFIRTLTVLGTKEHGKRGNGMERVCR